jgi:urease accessory protein
MGLFPSPAEPSQTPPVRLLLLLDSRSPAGAHGHSGGMEAAVTAGFVSDLADVEDFCQGRLRTAGRVAAGFAAAACRGWIEGWSPAHWWALDSELSARTSSPAARLASRQLGSGLRRLLRASEPTADLATPWRDCPAPAPHHPLVLGAACAMTDSSPRVAARAAALASCSAPASAAVRLLGLDPYAVHALLARLGPAIETVADVEAIAGSPLPTGSAPALELLADVHARQEVRLFAS